MVDYCYVQYVADTSHGGGGGDFVGGGEEFSSYFPYEINYSDVGAAALQAYSQMPLKNLSDLHSSSLYTAYWSIIQKYLPADWEAIFPADYTLYSVYNKSYGADKCCIYYSETSLSVTLTRFDIYFNVDIPSLDSPPDTIYDPNDVYFLYDVGKALVDNDLIKNLLGKSIGGVNLITILFGGSFMLYVSWVVVKWVIP